MIIDVIIDINNINVNNTYSYNVSKKLESSICLGQRVFVEFGHRDIVAFVVNIKEGNDESLKTMTELKDIKSYFTLEQFKLAIDLANRSHQTYVSVFNMFLPNALKLKYRTYLTVLESDKLPLEFLSKFENDKYYYEKFDDDIKEIRKYLKQKWIKNNFEINDRVSKKQIKVVKIVSKNVKTEKQREVIKTIESGVSNYTELRKLGYGNIIKTLEKNGLVYFEHLDVYREVQDYGKLEKNIILNLEQKNCYNEVKKCFGINQVFLLKGVTGSGKTEVYLNLIEDVINSGKTAFFLVPEISLTVQMLKRFYGRFKRISVVHSKLSKNSLYDEYQKILHGEIDIVIGARSAIFMPLEDIGIIVVDECHSESYHQDTMPVYDLEEVAQIRARYNNCPLVLGSATPKVAEYYKTTTNEYKLLEMKERAFKTKPPRIEIVDMKKSKDNLISELLDQEIKKAIKNNEQIILLHNRKGYSNYLMCSYCGLVKKCDNCDISLTYYKNENILRCHYCGKTYPVTACECGHPYEFFGYGIEQVKEILESTYGCSVLRMDANNTTKKGSMKKIVEDFENQKATILLGTSMVSKGLDFENVSLVGVLNSDNSLNMSSYNSAEKTYELVTQVAGRSGRREKQGTVIIQTYNPEHYIFKYLNDYQSFYEEEISLRALSSYPPFTKICLVQFRSENDSLLNDYSYQAYRFLKANLTKSQIIGPTAPIITKIKGKNIMNIMIKYNDESLDSVLHGLLLNKENGISVKIEFNPNFI